MIVKRTFVFLIYTIFFTYLSAQTGKTIRFSSSYSMFPDTARSDGHDYQGKHYDAATHYNDSSILVYVPSDFSPQTKINLVCWFHGWGNMIDSACKQFQLLTQFEKSGRNAIFIFPQGPKNAPDSYGGKLEQPAIFQLLIKEVVSKLTENKIIETGKMFNIEDYDISLAGHSGAYRVISKIINHSPVKEVILFDAMYGGNEAYLQWLSDPSHRFINIYTKEGGTYDNSHFIIDKLQDSLRVPIISVDEEAVTDRILQTYQKIFIFSKMGHNEVITHNHNWEWFLRNIPAKN
jgi:hypothetical protein